MRANTRGAVLFFLMSLAAGSTALPPAHGANGINLTGFGAESAVMGGADLAVARDTSALNTNPAGLSQIAGRAFDNYFAVAYAVDVSHADRFGNDGGVSNDLIALGGGGYAQRLGNSKITAGIGLFAQGGAGYVYEDLNTPFGARDELSALFRIAKLSPGLAYQVNDSLSLGASLGVIYADIEQKVFPDTSFFNAADPSRSFFGFKLEDARALEFGFRLGAQYRVNEQIRLGMAFSPKTELPLENGRVEANLSAIGLGKVTYRDARVEGLALPTEAGMGIAYEPAPTLLLSIELTWLDWSNALRSLHLRASNPENPAAPAVLENTAALDWRDQYVVAVGAAWKVNEKTVVRAGYNYGRNPVPARTLSPLLATIAEHHVALGFGRRVGAEWEIATGIEYQIPAKVTYTNPESPFGAGEEERNEVLILHLMLSRRW
ncbi:MAG: outer membrane protein transport protein [Burkholderiales bacterium]|nr:outer membrane protein transport protein [Burkholderiales bacterium]